MKKSISFLLTTIMATMLQAETINKIEFLNLSKVSKKIAAETTNIKIGDELNIEKINKTIKEFYKFGYFNDITVNSSKGILSFNFKEKPIIANISIEGYKSREEDQELLYSSIGLKKGSLYTDKNIKNGKKSLLKELEREGYINSTVEIDIEEINKNSVALSIVVNKGEEMIIKKASYFGSNKLDESDFEELTVNKEEDIFSWFFGQNSGEANLEQLPYDKTRIADIYMQKGYLDSKVKNPFMKVDFSSNEAELNYFIDEGKAYKISDIIIYVDNSIISPNKLYPELKLKKEKVFNIKKLRKDIEFIKTSVGNFGYAYTKVNYDLKKDKKTSQVKVIFNIIPGKKVYINDVLISGNGRTLDRVIRRSVYLAHGDLFSFTNLKDSKNSLQRTGYFEEVTISKKRVTDSKMDLIVKVKEAPTAKITFGAGYGSYDGFSINAGINETNIFGSGKALGIDVDTSDKRLNGKIYIKEPSINDSKYDAEFNIHSNEVEIEYDGDKDYTLDKNSIGFSVSVGTELFKNTRVGLVYKLDEIEVKYTDDDTTDSYDPFTYKSNEDYINSSLTPYVSYNSTDNHMFPTEGIKARSSLEFAGVGGDSKYLKSISGLSYYHSLEDRFDLDWIFKYKTSLKYLIDNGRISEGDSFYLGGVKSLRGYKSYAFGPESDSDDPVLKQTLTNSAEISIPLFSAKTRFAFFYDHGMIGEDSFNDTKRSSVGASLQWISPLGPIQFIFAEALDDKPGDETASFEFSMGQSF